MYALSELQVSWEHPLSSLGFEEQVSKTQKTPLVKKVRVSREMGSISKDVIKAHEKSSSIERETRSSKRNLSLQQE
jgi:hypothetical protein